MACSAAAQARRLRERGWDAVQSRQRLKAQWPVEKKIAQSDFVVWTDTTLEVHAAQLLRNHFISNIWRARLIERLSCR